MTPETIDQLAGLLDAATAGYDELLSLLQQEKSAAIESNARRLNCVIEKKAEALAGLASLDRQRDRLLKDIAAAMHIPQNQLSLSRLCDTMPTDMAQDIELRRSSLQRAAAKAQRANNENRILVRHCLALAHNAVGFFQHILNPASVYGASGQVRKSSGSGKLLSGLV